MAPDGEVVAEPTFIVWLDPGADTGLACYDMELDTGIFEEHDLVGLRKRLDQLIPLFGHRMAVGWEMFLNVGGPRSSTPGPSNEVIGMTRVLAEEHGIELLKPVPSSARKLGSVVFLKRLGWYRPGKGHANDAAQHLLAYLIHKRPVNNPVREKLFPGYGSRGTLAP